jgi:preprotein translocase subunit SecG
MTEHAIVTMIAVVGTVWGGFCILLAFALRSESRKSSEQETD